MASRKEYEMAFVLNAALNGNFKGTMSQAQREFVTLGNEIKNLQKVQNDISSYQKYEKAAESTQSKLENLQKQHDLLQKEISETNGDTSSLERQDLQLQQRIADTAQALENQRGKLDAVGQRLKENGIDTSNLTGESARLASEMGELKKKQDDAASSAEQYGDKASAGFMAAGEALMQSQLLDKLKELGEAYLDCVQLSMGFETSMSNVAALSGASADEMTALNETAKNLGATTKFTATEAADAMGYMAMAGWKSEQMIAGMDGVLQLAAASGEDLALTSDIVTDNLTAFGMSADETARFADVLAAAATNSNTSVSIMGETFKNSASVAGALGYSIEDVATMVGLMANAGVKGSVAGTALRNVFNGLLGGVTLTSDAFGEYEFEAVKADGTMKNLSETVEELRYYFDQMSESEKVANAQNLAGQRGYNGLLAIVNATEADFNKLTTAINNSSGAAARMADIKLDNLAGQMTLLESATDAIKVTIGEQFNPELRKLAEFATDAATKINDWIKENPALVKGVIAGTAALGGLVAAITSATMAVKAFKALKAAGAFTALTGPVGLAVAGVSLLAGAYVGLTTAAKENMDASWELTSVDRQRKEELDALTKEYEEACEVYGEASQEALSLKWKVDDLNAAYEAGKQTLDDYVATHNDLIDSYWEMTNSHEQNKENIEVESLSVLSLIQKLSELTATSDDAKTNQEAVLAVIQKLNEEVPELGLSYQKVIPGSEAFIDSLEEQAKAAAQAKLMQERYAEYGDQLVQQTKLENDHAKAVENATLAQQEYDEAYEAYSNAVAKSKQWDYTGLGTLLTTMDEKAVLDKATENLEAYRKAEEEAAAAVEDNAAKIQELQEEFRNYSEEVAEATEVTYTSSEDLIASMQSVTDEIAELQEAYDQAYESALSSLSGQFTLWDNLDEKLKDIEEHTVSQMTDSLAQQAEYWSAYNDNLDILASKTDSIQGLDQMIASFADGSADSVSAIASMASSSDADLQLMVDNWLAVQSAQQSAAEELAKFQTDFDEQMDSLTKKLEETVEEMDLTQDAANRGKDAIQAFIDGANAKYPDVIIAFQNLKKAADSALQGSVVTETPTTTTRGYATGTLSAEPGWSWVGENGPELMNMRGGETVLTAKQSAEVAGTSSTFSPQISINITGGADSNTMATLQAYLNGEFMDQLKELMEESQAEQTRRRYV